MENLPFGKKIILFDGVCNLCDTSVQFIIKYDKKDVFRFVSLQSELGQTILKHLGIDTTIIDSFILYEPGIAYYTKSEAAFKVINELGGIISILSIFSVFPKFFQDLGYDFIARNRYKWYGKKENCLVPTPELRSKFL